MSCRASDKNDPATDLAPYVAQIFSAADATDAVVFSAFFSIPACGQCVGGEQPPASPSSDGVHCVCGPYFELDYDRSIDEARTLFGKLYESEEFLPRAPDPEEIIVAGSDEDAAAAAEQTADESVATAENNENKVTVEEPEQQS